MNCMKNVMKENNNFQAVILPIPYIFVILPTFKVSANHTTCTTYAILYNLYSNKEVGNTRV